MNHQQYADIIKSAALSAGKKAVMSYIVTAVPFFALPIINPILGLVVNWVLTIAIDETEMGLFFMYIDFRTNLQGKEFEAAALENFRAQTEGTEEEKINAEKNLIAKFRALAKFSN